VCGQKTKGDDDEDDDGATTTTTKAVAVTRYRWWLPGNERAAHKTGNESIKSPRPVGGICYGVSARFCVGGLV